MPRTEVPARVGPNRINVERRERERPTGFVAAAPVRNFNDVVGARRYDRLWFSASCRSAVVRAGRRPEGMSNTFMLGGHDYCY